MGLSQQQVSSPSQQGINHYWNSPVISYFPSIGCIARINSKTTEIKDVFLLFFVFWHNYHCQFRQRTRCGNCLLPGSHFPFVHSHWAGTTLYPGLQGLQGNAMLLTLPTLPPRVSGYISGLFNPALFLSVQLNWGQCSAEFTFCIGLQECLGLAMYITFSQKWGMWQASHIIILQNRLENRS